MIEIENISKRIEYLQICLRIIFSRFNHLKCQDHDIDVTAYCYLSLQMKFKLKYIMNMGIHFRISVLANTGFMSEIAQKIQILLCVLPSSTVRSEIVKQILNSRDDDLVPGQIFCSGEIDLSLWKTFCSWENFFEEDIFPWGNILSVGKISCPWEKCFIPC